MRPRLVLVRHAKAAQGAPDISRPLTDRGRADAREIGQWLSANDAVPDIAIVSPATRTMQTWEAIGAAEARVVVDPRVWANNVGDLLDAIAEQADQTDDTTTIAIVGHNPSMHGLAVRLGGRFDEFPTATVAVFGLDSWHDLGQATLIASATCRAAKRSADG